MTASKLNYRAATVLFALLVSCKTRGTVATITIPDTRDQYASQPASFGMYFQEGREYIARLQSLFDTDPYLCDQENIYRNRQKIVVPDDGLPVALLAEKGYCTYEEKARIAQQLHSAVKYLVVFSNVPGDDTLVTMTAENHDGITIGSQYVSYKSGTDLLLSIEENGEYNEDGDNEGCRIYLDAYTNWDDLGWISWVFVLLTCIVSMFLCLSTGYIRSSNSNVRVIIVNGHRQYEELLTQEQVDDLSEMEYSAPDDECCDACNNKEIDSADEEDDVKNKATSDDPEKIKKFRLIEKYTSCSICLEDFEVGEKLRSLPCGHYFHSHCIGPWLTERQPTCPLCKANVKADIAQRNGEADEASNERLSFIQICCYPVYCLLSVVYQLFCCLFCCDCVDDEDQDSEEDLNSEASSSVGSDTMHTPLLEDEYEV